MTAGGGPRSPGGRSASGATVFLAAMRSEVSALVGRLVRRRRVADPTGNARVTRGRLGDRPLEVVVTGIGARNAERAAERCLRLAADGACSRVVWLGIAGALSPDLQVGDLVAAGIAAAPGRATVELDGELLRTAVAHGCRPGVVVTAPGLVATAASRHALWTRSGRRPATAVDMESHPSALVLQAAGIPLAVVRAISDTAADRLPAWLEGATAARGGLAPGAVAGGVVAHPASLGPLIRLRRRTAQLAPRLADAAAALA